VPVRSAGVVLYRWVGEHPQVLLVHPGGPFWARKDAGAWSIPKGLIEDGEDPLVAARREFLEETGLVVAGEFASLGDYKLPSGKVISAWAIEGDADLAQFRSNTFEIEWPPASGRTATFPEADRVDWFEPAAAREKITRGQAPILGTLFARLRER
jgi:predicted NUDIX family NTP pyrophosphohydrolase